jgi:hypothetical protein
MSKTVIIKLDAVVDNPDLPVVETMQQFTLDAIAASGNNNMTDAQKWALNHFFYQIGAINNDGVFAKTKYLFLPMICGSVKGKVLVNYKDNTTYSISSATEEAIAFDENGCVYAGSRTLQQITYQETTDCTDLFAAVGFPQMAASGSAAAFRAISAPCGGISQTSTVYQGGLNAFYMLYQKDSSPDPRGHIASTYNGEYDGLLVGASQDYTYDTTSGEEVIHTPPFLLRAQFDVSPVGLTMWGSHLTSQEMTTLAKAIRELMAGYFAS